MATKKGTYQVDNGSGFDEIMFKTIASQVICNDGKSVEVKISELGNQKSASIVVGSNLIIASGDETKATVDSNSIVTLNIAVNWNSSVNGCTDGYVIAKLPTGFRPANIVHTSALIMRVNGYNSSIGTIRIRPSGEIAAYIVTESTAFYGVRASISYKAV